MHLLEYLERYNPLFSVKLPPHQQSFPMHMIWQCWLQGSAEIPALVKACMKSVQTYHPHAVIKKLDLNTLHKFIAIPQILLDKYAQGKIAPAHLCDYIRVALLAKYGGTWIDATVFCTGELPKAIYEQEFFAFKFPSWCQLTSMNTAESFFSQSLHITKMCFSNWFIHAQSQNRLMQLLQLFLEKYWTEEDAVFDYFMFHIFATYIILKDSACQSMFKNMLEISNAYPHLLQQCLHKEFDPALYESIKNASPIHKLTHKLSHKLHDDVPANSFTKHIVTSTP